MKPEPHLKKFWADKTFDLTNIGVGATLFGQFVSDKKFSWAATIVGFILLVVGYIARYFLYQK